MVLINSTTMQAMAKIVYYGPGLCGKTTNLQHIHARTAPGSRGEMISLETETDRTLFFDLLPLEVGIIGGMKVRLQLYTVPGQVFYNVTRRLVLKNVDGIVFVADSQEEALEANIEALRHLQSNLADLGLRLEDIPRVLQYNKRDLRQIVPIATLQRELNPGGAPHFEAVARDGKGVFETLKEISRLALSAVRAKVAPELASEKVAPAPPVAAATAPRKEDTEPLPSLPGNKEDTSPLPALEPSGPPPRPAAARQAVPFSEEETLELKRPVTLRLGGAETSEIAKRATVEVPAQLLRSASRLGVHLSFQGDEVSLRDAATIRLSRSDRAGRLRLRLDLEIEPKE